MNFIKFDTLTNILIFLVLALTVGYLTQKNYEAILFLYIFSAVIYLLSKNIALSLGLSIIFTNLLISLNYFNYVENFKGKDNKKKLENLKNRLKKEKKE